LSPQGREAAMAETFPNNIKAWLDFRFYAIQLRRFWLTPLSTMFVS
jgi:hypothetical protein